jgi:aryl carrier-like protein
LVEYIKMDLVKRGWDGVNSIDLVQDRRRQGALVNLETNLPIP